MDIYEKIRKIRMFKGWSQEVFAEKLNLSPNGYAKIERGERNMSLERLQQIASVLNIELLQLLDLNDKTAFTNVIVDNGSTGHNFAGLILTETKCAYELEKYQLITQAQAVEIEHLKKQINQLEEINRLLNQK